MTEQFVTITPELIESTQKALDEGPYIDLNTWFSTAAWGEGQLQVREVLGATPGQQFPLWFE